MMQEMTRARRFITGMMLFWNGVTYLMLTLFTVYTLLHQPGLAHSGRGIIFGLLVLAYILWYSLGFRWLMGPERVWRGRYFARRALYWLPLFVLPLPLVTIDPVFVNLEWAAVGGALGLLLPPWNIVGVGAALIPLIISWGIWPTTNTPAAWLTFALALLTIVIYCAVIYLPYILITQRFKLARLYTDLHAAHTELAAAHEQLAASAARERELAVLRERERLARDMHDTLGHALALTTVKLEAIRRLSTRDPARAAHEVDATEGIVRGALGELRATLTALRAAPCLSAALRAQAEAAGERAGLSVTVQCSDATDAWPPAVGMALLRIGAEAIANVERHAHARHLTLTLIDDAGQACLCVADDGVGLPPHLAGASGTSASPPGHYGLTGMHERAGELGGTLCVTSLPDGGTTIEARLPLCGDAALPASLPSVAQVS